MDGGEGLAHRDHAYPDAGFLVARVVNKNGLLGQNILGANDAEYDLASGVIRLGRALGCEHSSLAYWAPPGRTYSVVELQSINQAGAQLIGSAELKGVDISVGFDTGSATSLVSLRAAKRAGITPLTPGVVSAGSSYGPLGHSFRIWIAPFRSCNLDTETISAPRLRIGDIGTPIDMLLGADFFNVAPHLCRRGPAPNLLYVQRRFGFQRSATAVNRLLSYGNLRPRGDHVMRMRNLSCITLSTTLARVRCLQINGASRRVGIFLPLL